MATAAAPDKQMGTCPLCGRPMVSGPSIDEHHLVPASFGGKEKTLMHRICHQKIHATLSEKELAAWYHTVERLRSQEDIRKFIAWVRRKPPEYYDRSRFSQQRRRAR
jgi:hypothetical protein